MQSLLYFVASFHQRHSMQMSPVVEGHWQAQKAALDKALAPLDELVASKILNYLTGIAVPALTAANLVHSQRATGTAAAAAQPLQIFQNLLKRRQLLSRPGVAAALHSEANAVAELMQGYLKNLEASASAGHEGGGATLRALVWLRQARHKAGVAGQVLSAFAAASDVAHAMHSQVAEVTQRLLFLEKVWTPGRVISVPADRMQFFKAYGACETSRWHSKGKCNTAL
jgi:hypothetical protein